ncbi:MAG: hypothetical protein ABID61_05565 [Candidatus Micrarchaeota archaeon]
MALTDLSVTYKNFYKKKGDEIFMAKPGFDFKKLLLASLVIIGIGIVLTILSTILKVLPAVVPDDLDSTISFISMVFSLLLYPIFFLLYFWSGVRASKNYGFDLVGAGYVAAFSYFIVTIISIIVNTLLGLIVLAKPIGNFAFGSIETVFSSILFSEVSDFGGVGISALCGVGIAIIGALMNFVIGGVGGWLVLRRKM